MCWVETTLICVQSKCLKTHGNLKKNVCLHLRLWMWNALPLFRCKKKVPATKRFTVHRTSNVLTLSLKRFANFSGGKITKVERGSSHIPVVWKSLHSVSHIPRWRVSPSGCWLSRIPEHSPVHVPELRRAGHVRPLCCPGALWLQLSRWPLLLLRQGEAPVLFHVCLTFLFSVSYFKYVTESKAKTR